jgi:hypothetical protein
VKETTLQRLDEQLADDERSDSERARLIELMALFSTLPPPPDRYGLFPLFRSHQARFIEALDTGNGEAIEEAFLLLYCYVHGYEAPYTPTERARMDETGGYWCHAGGLSPILKAEPFIHRHTVSIDFGAGNGLQGLLLQKLFSHCRTVQIEISTKMVEVGKALQWWLGIDDSRVEWIAGDVLDHVDQDADFIYLYRPVRPEGKGLRFYERLSARLNRIPKKVVIFSVADCLGPFLGERFKCIFGNGHLTCFQNGALDF